MERKKRKWKRRKANPFTEAGLLKTREVISELEKAINQPSNSNLLPVLQHVCARVLRHFSCVRFFVTPWTVAQQAPLSMRFSMQKYWVGCHFLLQGIFLTQSLSPRLLCLLQELQRHWKWDGGESKGNSQPQSAGHAGLTGQRAERMLKCQLRAGKPPDLSTSQLGARCRGRLWSSCWGRRFWSQPRLGCWHRS